MSRRKRAERDQKFREIKRKEGGGDDSVYRTADVARNSSSECFYVLLRASLFCYDLIDRSPEALSALRHH